MDLILEQIRAAYQQNPKSFVAFFVVSAALGLAFGYIEVGPAMFG